MKSKTVFLFLFISSIFFGQNVNIIPQLKKIEAGNLEDAKYDLKKLKTSNPSSPNVIFLEAVTTEDGEVAQNLYEVVYNDFPNSQFADAALFRSFSYYYALGLYKKAEELKSRLLKEYPNSPYLKNTERSFAQVDEMIVVDNAPYNIKKQTGMNFTTQAGAFSNRNNADELKNKFLVDGFTSKITPKTVNSIQLYVVTVGNYNKKEDAEKFLDVLQKKYSIKGRVINLD